MLSKITHLAFKKNRLVIEFDDHFLASVYHQAELLFVIELDGKNLLGCFWELQIAFDFQLQSQELCIFVKFAFKPVQFIKLCEFG